MEAGLTIEQIVAGAPLLSGVFLVRWIVANEVAAGRVVERDGRYMLSAEVWTPRPARRARAADVTFSSWNG